MRQGSELDISGAYGDKFEVTAIRIRVISLKRKEIMIKMLENTALINGISLIISVLIPILVMVCTLRSENKRFERQMKEAEKEFKKTLQTEMEHYSGNMQLQKENSRVSQLPFLFLDPNIKLGERMGSIIFPLKICNKGNGTALDIRVVSRPDGAGKGIGAGLAFVYKEKMGENINIYRYTGYLFTNVLPVNSEAEFELLLDSYNERQGNLRADQNIGGTVCFSIKYKDTYYNEYEQQFMFQYSYSYGVGRCESYLPHLVKQHTDV